MTKPQFAPEPSMEDILASIRKMISEDRLGPRPVPDLLARAPLANGSADSDAGGGEPDAADAPERKTQAPLGRTERAGPSFSSLSHALKAAIPSEEMPTIDDKIADMLAETERPSSGGPNGRPAAASSPTHAPLSPSAPAPASPTPSARTPLAVFAASRTSAPATPALPEPEPEVGANAPGRPVTRAPMPSERTQPANGPRAEAAPKSLSEQGRPRPAPPHGPGLNGGAPKTAASAGTPGTTSEPPAEPNRAEAASVSRPATGRDDARPGGRPAPPATPKAAAQPASGEQKSEPQRIITMPARFPTAASGGDGTHASEAAASAASTSGLGLRPAGAKSAEQAPPAAPSVAEPASETAAKAKGAASPSVPPASLKSETAKEPSAPEGEKKTEAEPAAAATPHKKAAVADPGAALQALKEATWQSKLSQAEKPEHKQPSTPSMPSEALVDAVIEMVHKEPSSLSVFTSGADFIHGVGHAPVPRQSAKPGPNEVRKLDRSAAELLRPMLRQWLAENMPRIVEEALRSELMSSQDPAKDSDKA